MSFSEILHKFLETFHVRTPIGGLSISDSVVRLAVPQGQQWQLYSQRLPAGAVEDGIVKNRASFLEAVASLKRSSKRRYGKKMPVVVSLSSSQIYVQTFSLPLVQSSEEDKAIALNLKMISPVNYPEVYASWQYLKKDKNTGRAEILSAFLRRLVADELDQILEQANFRPLVLEPRSLSVTRFIRSFDSHLTDNDPRVVLLADDEGIDFLVIKESQLCFEHAELWKNLYEPGKSITSEEFGAAVKRSTQQLLNFYGQRWTDPLGEFLIIAPGLASQIADILRNDFSFQAKELSFPQKKDIGSEWFGVIGATWRSLTVGPQDTELSLLNDSAQKKFIKERFVDFLALWSVIVPASLIVILCAMLAGDLLIIRQAHDLGSRATSRFSAEDRAAMTQLEDQAVSFNATVALMESAKQTKNSKTYLIKDLFERALAQGVEIRDLRLENSNRLTLSGGAPVEEKIILFKKSLLDGGYENIELPLAGIHKESAGYGFSMTFSLMTEKTP